MHNNVNVYFEGGWEKKKKGLHVFPFSPEVETFYWLKGDKRCPYLDDGLSRGCQYAREGICSKKDKLQTSTERL